MAEPQELTAWQRTDIEANLSKVASEELKDGLKILGKVDSFFFDVYDIKVRLLARSRSSSEGLAGPEQARP